TSSADQYTYTASSTSSEVPAVFALSASTGSTLGGTPVTIFGSGFLGATAVMFGSVAAASVSVDEDGSITAGAPAQAAGAVGVTLQNQAGTSATSDADQFIYSLPGDPPAITGLDVSHGSMAGGDVVTISGSNFRNVNGVSFVVPASGGNPATAIPATLFLV